MQEDHLIKNMFTEAFEDYKPTVNAHEWAKLGKKLGTQNFMHFSLYHLNVWYLSIALASSAAAATVAIYTSTPQKKQPTPNKENIETVVKVDSVANAKLADSTGQKNRLNVKLIENNKQDYSASPSGQTSVSKAVKTDSIQVSKTVDKPKVERKDTVKTIVKPITDTLVKRTKVKIIKKTSVVVRDTLLLKKK